MREKERKEIRSIDVWRKECVYIEVQLQTIMKSAYWKFQTEFYNIFPYTYSSHR
jgi:hypothetical protein